MNMLSDKFTTVEEGMEELKKGVSLRNKMSGALYWNILNDDCHAIADKLISMGADTAEVSSLLG